MAQLILFDGNSLTLGLGASVGHDYPTVVLGLLGGTWQGFNFGVGGQTTADMIADAATQIDTALQPRARNVLVAWEGTNDLYFGASAATSFARLSAYCAARRAAGFKVVLLSVLPRNNEGTPAGFEASRVALNALLAAHWSEFADRYVDVAADARLSDTTNMTYFGVDQVHLTEAGYAVVGGLVAPPVSTL